MLNASTPPSFILFVREVYKATAPPCENPPITILSDGIDLASSSTRDFTIEQMMKKKNYQSRFKFE